MAQTLIEGALEWASNGVPVFPCGDNKRPLTNNGFYDAVTDPVAVRELFNMYGGAARMIGARMGEQSGLFALDFDLYKGGEPKAYMQRLIDEGCLPDSRVHTTKNGGLHVIYESETSWPNLKPCPGVEIKGEGGYIIVPPSPGYEVTRSGLISAPDLLLQLLHEARHVASSASIDDLRMAVIQAKDFHDSLVGIAARLFAKDWKPEDVMVYLLDVLEKSSARNPQNNRHGRWSQLMGDKSAEISRIVESGYKKYAPSARINAFDEQRRDVWEDVAAKAGFFQPSQNPSEGEMEAPVYQGTENPFLGEGTWAHDHHDVLSIMPIAYPLLMENEVSLIRADAKQGKTAFNLTLALHIALGWDFGEIKIPEPRAVVYFALEGVSAIHQRVEAFKQNHGIDTDIPLFIRRAPANLSDAGVRNTLVAKILQFDKHAQAEYEVSLGYVVFDTLTKAMPGGDQNSAEETSSVFEMHSLLRETSLSMNVNYVHHNSKMGQARGSTNIEAEMDIVLTVEKKESQIKVHVPIARSIESGGSYLYNIKTVNLGQNMMGYDVNSFILVPDETAPEEVADIKGAQDRAKAKDIIVTMGQGVYKIGTLLREFATVNVGPCGPKGRTVSPRQGNGAIAQAWFYDVIGAEGIIYKNHALELVKDGGLISAVSVRSL